jgi:hypothetical protein
MLTRAANALLLLLFVQVTAVAFGAVSPDPRLLQLVPPGSPIVAGVHSAANPDLPRNYLMVTANNHRDLNDFLALTGVDTTRVIREVVFVAGDISASKKEHSLLVSGLFGRSSIFKYADGVKASTKEYRGIPVLVVSPFEREREYLKDIRWLAIPESNIAIFGTESSVQCELDRYLDHSRPDAVLVERLDRMNKKDVTWNVVGMPLPGDHLKMVLGMLDPELGAAVERGGTLQLGFQFGRQVTVEYELTPVPNSSSTSSDAFSRKDESARPPRIASSLLSSAGAERGSEAIHGVVKVPMHRYEEWLSKMLVIREKDTDTLK